MGIAGASAALRSPLAAALLAIGLGTGAAHASEAPAALAPGPAASDPTLPPEPNVQRTVNEDDHVRIEELRVRGRTQRIAVQPKLPGAPAYEVLPGDGTSDSAGSADGHRGGGQRVWNVLKF